MTNPTASRKPLAGRKVITPQPYPDFDDEEPVAPLTRPPEAPPNESALESLGRAITSPVRGAAEADERKQTGK